MSAIDRFKIKLIMGIYANEILNHVVFKMPNLYAKHGSFGLLFLSSPCSLLVKTMKYKSNAWLSSQNLLSGIMVHIVFLNLKQNVKIATG